MEIKVYRNLMGENDRWATLTRELARQHRFRILNIIGSPGAGKTFLLEETARRLQGRLRFAVLEGDVETTRDAERLHRLGVTVSQLLTDGACHLEAKLVHHALRDLPLTDLDLVIVENVGNLVCPAEFDIGESMKMAVLSVTEGEDKPLKYPLLFREAQVVVLTKTDLLPHIPYRHDDALASIRQINAQATIFSLSAFKGDGMDAWCDWLLAFASQHA